MAQPTTTKAPQTIQPPAPAAEVTPWPASVPALSSALKILSELEEPPEVFRAVTRRFLSQLTFVERAAVHEANPVGENATLCQVAAICWRLAAALEVRPTGEEPTDPAAMDLLITEVDQALAILATLSVTEDADLKEACDKSRASLASGVQELIPTTSSGPAAAALSPEERLALRTAAALGKRTVVRIEAPGQEKLFSKKARLIAMLALGLVGIAASVLVTLPEKIAPVPALPELPPGAILAGDINSGAVAVKSTDGKPMDPEAVSRFKEQATRNGALVREVSPMLLIVTPAKPE